jgi:hypothetical protein
MRFLDRNSPDLGEVREALACIADDADRAGDIIDRIRDHIKIRTISIAFSRLSTPRSRAAQGWDCRSAGRSSVPTGAGCGQT